MDGGRFGCHPFAVAGESAARSNSSAPDRVSCRAQFQSFRWRKVDAFGVADDGFVVVPEWERRRCVGGGQRSREQEEKRRQQAHGWSVVKTWRACHGGSVERASLASQVSFAPQRATRIAGALC